MRRVDGVAVRTEATCRLCRAPATTNEVTVLGRVVLCDNHHAFAEADENKLKFLTALSVSLMYGEGDAPSGEVLPGGERPVSVLGWTTGPVEVS